MTPLVPPIFGAAGDDAAGSTTFTNPRDAAGLLPRLSDRLLSFVVAVDVEGAGGLEIALTTGRLIEGDFETARGPDVIVNFA
mmetsp:Transcript_49118/g.56576  ORF Transcript_49118/g.56576 Transcript_49118/m.56576 type:complete len:82 (+) Transcript_49118:272-517(+)